MDVLFKDAAAALSFGFRFSDSQFEISAVAKMVKGVSTGTGKGLVGNAGAAQAGMVMANVQRLKPLEQACIVGRYSLRFVDCECGNVCCMGEKVLKEYQDAILLLDREVAQLAVTGISKRQMRHAIIRAYFENDKKRKPIKINEYADRLKVARRTAHDHKTKIWAALADLDKTARTHIDSLLSGMVGELQEVAA